MLFRRISNVCSVSSAVASGEGSLRARRNNFGSRSRTLLLSNSQASPSCPPRALLSDHSIRRYFLSGALDVPAVGQAEAVSLRETCNHSSKRLQAIQLMSCRMRKEMK